MTTQKPTFDDLPKEITRTRENKETWAKLRPEMQRRVVREAASIIEEYGVRSMNNIVVVLIAGG